ncbi:ganglioside-induced differentiation-associated protein 1 [Ornithorhynchus anatinus]|uniref:Ganglioside induced differentiation associated protein 1 n=1 Tax=Ornithorhynchus anatinus TaxID=9258 RepID=A0A6I8PC49_ORNAN|nr:ganglioside-induced differentiation-associated protein 1 [Ornithorhynchus anatinus]
MEDLGPDAGPDEDGRPVLYHWSHSFSSQKVRLALAEKGVCCRLVSVSLPLGEHHQPWFMRLSPEGDVPVLVHRRRRLHRPDHIVDYLERAFPPKEGVVRLLPEEGSPLAVRVQHYRELLDSLPVDAYTLACLLRPQLARTALMPAAAAHRIRSHIANTESELKQLAEQHPDLRDAYLAKQMRLKSKLRDHDNVQYLNKILDELEKVLDQVEMELQRRNEETPEEGHPQPWLCCEAFTLADVSLAVTLHRLSFLGLAQCNWGAGKRPNLEAYYERVQRRETFRRVLGRVNNILLSAVLPTALHVARRKAPRILGTALTAGLLAGAAYLALTLGRRRLGGVLSALGARWGLR